MSDAIASPEEQAPSIDTTFKDLNGNTWDLTLDVGLVEDVKEKSSVDLDAMLKKPEELAGLLLATPAVLVQLLWVICEEQAEARGIEPRAFGRLFKRNVIDDAVNSLIMAIVLFYPRGSAGRALAERLPAIIRQMDKSIAGRAKANADKLSLDMPTG